eukprot:TRINITY_DN66831_c7_g7_i1.p1 TRINITY_DN66831_c7_g7~~TRINITY_DN66831_c7_g7_i1.p1  ORF type:complete len:633 (-),score=317.92 TRINITY_DN66831_c7_g7_i1:501-2360(-)
MKAKKLRAAGKQKIKVHDAPRDYALENKRNAFVAFPSDDPRNHNNKRKRAEQANSDKKDDDSGSGSDSDSNDGNRDGDNDDQRRKRQRVSKANVEAAAEGKLKCMRDVATPWWRLPYSEQLQRKADAATQEIKRSRRRLRKKFPGGPWDNGPPGLLCPVLPIMASPQSTEYRNKSDFTIGLGPVQPYTAAHVASLAALGRGADDNDNNKDKNKNNSDEKSEQKQQQDLLVKVLDNVNRDASEVGFVPWTGFRLTTFRGATRDGLQSQTMVSSPEECSNLPLSHRDLAAKMTTLVRRHEARWSVFNHHTHQGVWRRLMVRTSSATKQLMLVVQLRVESLDEPGIEALHKVIVDYFVSQLDAAWSARFDGLRLSTILVQHHSGWGNSAPMDCPYRVLWDASDSSTGDSADTAATVPRPRGRIVEQVCGLHFSLSASAFFQVNTACAEKLYQQAIEWAECGPKTVVLDVCCGTGTIGIIVAKHVSQVVGLEIVKDAVRDAEANAKANNMTNVSYAVGPAESTIKSVLARSDVCSASSLVAIVDPPRNGLHKNVLKALRATKKLNRIVYVSCNPTTLGRDLDLLLRPKTKNTWPGEPFRADRAMPVDMFPQTPHCEMIVQLSR